jgi:hypothetical protein
MTHHVYVIGQDLTEETPYFNCYVGVTNNLKRRWTEHARGKYRIGNYIRSNDLSYDQHMMSIFFGTDIECFELERLLRPLPGIGLNDGTGGHGGYSGWSELGNKRKSMALKGRKILWADKISETRVQEGTAKGHKNPMAKDWTITAPNKTEFRICGSLYQFCDEHSLLVSCLWRYRGIEVPKPKYNGYGGYRAKNEESLRLRKNTSGWKLVETTTS